MVSDSPQPLIEIRDPSGKVYRYRISENTLAYSLGRAPGNDFIVPHASISRRHMQIQWRQRDALVIHDTGSTNGIIVNGVQISGDVDVYPEDSIRIGDLEMRVFMPESTGETVVASSDSMRTHADSHGWIRRITHPDIQMLLGGIVLLIAGILAIVWLIR